MASKIEIINLALAHLGQPAITSVGDNVRAARVMDLLWDPVRKAVLADYAWAFAERRATLALLGAAPPFGYSAKYALPSDFIRLISVNCEVYRIESGALATNEGTPNLVYVGNETNPEQFDPKFVIALSFALARDGCMGIVRRGDLRNAMVAAYATALPDARGTDSQQQAVLSIEPNAFLEARWSGAVLPSTDRPFKTGVEEPL